ncbi:MAG: VWA domain-containing protein [Nitrospirae bacterium]|nr:MAG: VWA domain-containing protein [Nitrospirota bacterium]
MASQPIRARLHHRLRDQLNETMASEVLTALAERQCLEVVAELLDELEETSSKIAREAVRALPEFHRRCGMEPVVPWLDFGIALTQRSGALGLRYFKESPLILGLLDAPGSRQQVLTVMLELADGQGEAAHCAFEFFRKTPELAMIVQLEALPAWGELGIELAQWNYVVGSEFFQQLPSIARALPQDLVREWVQFGMKLIAQNSLGKPDYIGTLEFFRTSPLLLECMEDPDVKRWVIRLGSSLADTSPTAAIAFLADSAGYLDPLPTLEWRLKVLKYGLLVAERDAEATLAYLRRAADLLALASESEQVHKVFDDWFGGGMEVLGYSVEGGRAYFSMETRGALMAVEQAMSGVALRQVARSLKLFVQGLCGTEVRIEPLPDSSPIESSRSGTGSQSTRARVSPDGTTIYVPSLIRWGSTKAENERMYLVMVAHEAGHLEFGTYRMPLADLVQLADEVRARYGAVSDTESVVIRTLADVFALYPSPRVIQDVWEILEDARVEFLLQTFYPGLRADLAALTKSSLRLRSFVHGMTAREMVLDHLLLRFAGEPDAAPLPESLREVVERMWTVAKMILRSDATALDAIRLADRLYQILDDMIGQGTGGSQLGWVPQDADMPSEEEIGMGPPALDTVSREYRPITNWAYRGEMDPQVVRGHANEETSPHERLYQEEIGSAPEHAPNAPRGQDYPDVRSSAEEKQPNSEYGSSPLEQWLERDDRLADRKGGEPVRSYEWRYDEWDGTIRDYRPRWCRVVERRAEEGSADFVDRTRQVYASEIRLLRRYFETIRPTALRRVGRQENGEDFDLDALVGWMSDRRMGGETSGRVYIRRDKRERHVAVAFLLDISGSTGRQLGLDQRVVLDIEKESLVLLSEALEAIGDRYALYAYSGQGRDQVDIAVLKGFEETSVNRAALRIGGLTPQKQNRDGAALRHVTARLLQQPAHTRLLVLVSDGKPLDDGYGDEYALEDTKMALQEACAKGIHPFCITIDQEASGYLQRMYGDVGYVVVDDVGKLPIRLPRIYHRLTA